MEQKETLIPNSTQIPNYVLDMVLPRIPEGEARCLLYICRRTFGFHKQEDNISFTQFEHGIKTSQSRQLDLGTGLSRPTISTALRNLIGAGAISVEKRSAKGNRYRLNIHMDVDKVVKEINQLRKLTKIGKAALPKTVKLFNPQKKEKKEKQSLRQSVGPPVDIRGMSRDLARTMSLKQQ
jgi:predicted transcriptional regulator